MSASNTARGNTTVEDDARSEYGGLFEAPHEASSSVGASVRQVSGGNVPREGITRAAPVAARGFGRGPVQQDPRKFRYDVERARTMAPVAWSATKADRMDPREAGDMLHSIHVMFGIDAESENRIAAFDSALFFEHTLNGASQLQPSRGAIVVDGQAFEIAQIVAKLGLDARRFFRAYANEVAVANRAVMDSYDPYDLDSVDKVSQLREVALKRGLHKFPHLAHDSSEACTDLSGEELTAVVQAKKFYLAGVDNNVDKLVDERVSG